MKSISYISKKLHNDIQFIHNVHHCKIQLKEDICELMLTIYLDSKQIDLPLKDIKYLEVY